MLLIIDVFLWILRSFFFFPMDDASGFVFFVKTFTQGIFLDVTL